MKQEKPMTRHRPLRTPTIAAEGQDGRPAQHGGRSYRPYRY